jgi:iron complex outermembrane receptor protein
VNALADGSTRIDLRGLQPQRTLTLLNGRRVSNGGIGADASVDFDSLPLSMIDRVEVLTTGASAVYGADAIGGVVNVITRSQFKGVEVGLQRSETSRGDGTITRAQALVGGVVAQGSWMLGADYVDQKGVSMAAREYSAVPLRAASVDGARVPDGSVVIPDGIFEIPDGNALGLPSGLYTRVPGAAGQAASDWRPYDDETFNFAPYTYLQTPNERGSLWLLGINRWAATSNCSSKVCSAAVSRRKLSRQPRTRALASPRTISTTRSAWMFPLDCAASSNWRHAPSVSA